GLRSDREAVTRAVTRRNRGQFTASGSLAHHEVAVPLIGIAVRRPDRKYPRAIGVTQLIVHRVPDACPVVTIRARTADELTIHIEDPIVNPGSWTKTQERLAKLLSAPCHQRPLCSRPARTRAAYLRLGVRSITCASDVATSRARRRDHGESGVVDDRSAVVDG